VISDGRDTAPKCSTVYLSSVESALAEAGGQIATVSGRYYAMDRDNRWERVQLAFDALVHGKGNSGKSAESVIKAAWEDDKTDEFILPAVIDGAELISAGDQAVFFNFRNDRPRELSSALIDSDFDSFDRGQFQPISLTTMTKYHPDFDCPVAFVKDKPESTLGAVVEAAGVGQYHSAETEKYPHVTFFFNGGKEEPYEGEERGLIASPKVDTYDLQPEMSAAEVAGAFVGAIEDGYDLIVCNFANPDMVGHTGDIDAAIAACEAVDTGLGAVLDALEKAGGAMIVTADHGNCETMVDPETGGPHTAHTINPVPVALVGGPEGVELRNGRLADLAPTLLGLMGLDLPDEMTGRSLIS